MDARVSYHLSSRNVNSPYRVQIPAQLVAFTFAQIFLRMVWILFFTGWLVWSLFCTCFLCIQDTIICSNYLLFIYRVSGLRLRHLFVKWIPCLILLLHLNEVNRSDLNIIMSSIRIPFFRLLFSLHLLFFFPSYYFCS